MMDSALAQFLPLLADQNFISHLLEKGKSPYPIAGINLEALYSFYPTPYARCTFHVRTSSEAHYLLKLNQDGSKIHREVAVCRWLRRIESQFFHVPDIIAWHAEEGFPSSARVHWLVGEWVSARSTASHLKQSIEPPEQIIRGLVWLNKLRITVWNALSLFHIHLPQEDILLKIMSQRRNAHFDALFEICGSKTRAVFQPLQQAVATYAFSKQVGLVHGDFHLDNILLSLGPTKPEFTWIDWEDATLDHPLSDIAHLLVFEEFSAASRAWLQLYLQYYNRYTRKERRLSMHEAWLLAAVWLARTVCWNLRMQTSDKRRSIEQQAVRSAQFILDQVKG